MVFVILVQLKQNMMAVITCICEEHIHSLDKGLILAIYTRFNVPFMKHTDTTKMSVHVI